MTARYIVQADNAQVATFAFYVDAVAYTKAKNEAYPGTFYAVHSQRGTELYCKGPRPQADF